MTVSKLEGVVGEFPEASDVVTPLYLRISKTFFPLDADALLYLKSSAEGPEILNIYYSSIYNAAIGDL